MGETGIAWVKEKDVMGEAHSDCDCEPEDPSVMGEDMSD